MAWMSFALGAFVGVAIGMMVMALASVTGRASEQERLNDAYWEGRREERQALKAIR